MRDEPVHVLVVDDDFRVAALHVAFVEKLPGFDVVGQANSAAEAIQRATSLNPDLVLLDIYLPDGDGLTVIRDLGRLASPPAVLVVSAASDVETVQQAVQLGAVNYLVKPFAFAALAERLLAFGRARDLMERWPEEARQDDVDHLLDALRPPQPTGAHVSPDGATAGRFAPTTQLVYEAVAATGPRVSASEIAVSIGISRATAQRCLARLERSDVLELELRYGHAGRPEHRYSVRRKT